MAWREGDSVGSDDELDGFGAGVLSVAHGLYRGLISILLS
jgi:hypothetical protein